MKRSLAVIGLALLGVGSAVVLAAGDPTFIGVTKCKMCHRLQFKSWQGTAHARATDTAKASTERAFEAACLSCHATNADDALPGVQCEACHGAGSDYWKASIMKDTDKATAAGLVLPGRDRCDGCHDGRDHHTAVEYTADVHAHKR